MLSTPRFASSLPRLLLAGLLAAGACGDDSGTGGDDDAGMDGDVEVDAGPMMSQLYGNCTEDSQCPGPEGVCLTTGFPNGLCSRSCFIDPNNPEIRDATNCLQTFPNGMQRFGACVDVAGQGACLPTCVAAIDCGGPPFACATITPAPGAMGTVDVCQVLCASAADCGEGAECNPYNARCVAPGGTPTTGAEIGEACSAEAPCKSDVCAAGIFGRAAPGGYCVGTCRIPPESSFAGSLPRAGCPGGAVCLPGTEGSAGTCADECVPGGEDCRAGYFCANVLSGVTFSNGICVPEA